MAKATTKLNAQDRVILFCTATGIDHAAVGIPAHAMQSMAIRGFIAHNRESGANQRCRLCSLGIGPTSTAGFFGSSAMRRLPRTS
jgi:hypothetical protein